ERRHLDAVPGEPAADPRGDRALASLRRRPRDQEPFHAATARPVFLPAMPALPAIGAGRVGPGSRVPRALPRRPSRYAAAEHKTVAANATRRDSRMARSRSAGPGTRPSPPP